MTGLQSRRTAINNDQGIVNTWNFFNEVGWYAIGLVPGHVWIHTKYVDYLVCVHGARSSRTLPSGVISQ